MARIPLTWSTVAELVAIYHGTDAADFAIHPLEGWAARDFGPLTAKVEKIDLINAEAAMLRHI